MPLGNPAVGGRCAINDDRLRPRRRSTVHQRRRRRRPPPRARGPAARGVNHARKRYQSGRIIHRRSSRTACSVNGPVGNSNWNTSRVDNSPSTNRPIFSQVVTPTVMSNETKPQRQKPRTRLKFWPRRDQSVRPWRLHHGR